MTKHTKGPWKIIKSFIVADPRNAPNGCSKTDLEAYGGYLVAESILHPPNRALIASSLKLLKAVEDIITIFEGGTYAIPFDIEQLKYIRDEALGKFR